MSALAAANPVKHTGQSLAQSEADLRTEATAIEKLRKQISEGGTTTSKEMMAEFAKRQKAYLDRKIELEKQKRLLGETPTSKTEAVNPQPAKVPETAKTAAPIKAPEPAKPAAEKKAESAKTSAPEPAKKTEPAKPAKPSEKAKPVETPKAKDAVEAPAKKTGEPKKKAAPAEKSDAKTAMPEKSSAKPREPESRNSPARKSGGVSPLVWFLVVATLAAVAWYFLSK